MDYQTLSFSFFCEPVPVGVVAAPIHASMSTSAVHPPFDTLPSSIPAQHAACTQKEDRKANLRGRSLVSCHPKSYDYRSSCYAVHGHPLPHSLLLRASASAVSDTFYMLSEGPTSMSRTCARPFRRGGGLRGRDLRLRYAYAVCERGSTVRLYDCFTPLDSVKLQKSW